MKLAVGEKLMVVEGDDVHDADSSVGEGAPVKVTVADTAADRDEVLVVEAVPDSVGEVEPVRDTVGDVAGVPESEG